MCKGDSTMKMPILFASCILVMYTVSRADIPENIYNIPTPGPLILTGIGIASIGCLHRKKRLCSLST